MSEEDKELELLKAKRLLEMKKNISLQQKQEEQKAVKQDKKTDAPNPRDVLIKQLGYRGQEVLKNAESQFPEETKMVVDKLADLIRSGEVTETIDGGKLLTLFRSLGIRVRVATTIKVEQDGKLVSWSDKLKESTSAKENSENQTE